MNEKINASVLILDDDPDVLQAAKLYLKQHIQRVETSTRPREAINQLKPDHFDVILLDMNFTLSLTSGEEGLQYLQEIKRIDPSLEVILITAYGDVELAVKAIKEGATDFVLKPWQDEKLLATITTACNLRQSRHKIKELQIQKEHLIDNINKPFYSLLGRSEPMERVFELIKKVSRTDANILITGENGTGKELVSRAIHRDSLRRHEPFISVDMGAISETLFESELFGHKKGAFTDAQRDRAGHFEIASGGTLFLDEIGNLPLSLQAKILRVLESREVKRLGSNQVIPLNIRLICATNRDINRMVEEGHFRQDLIYRINTIECHIPPLRERGEDIILLVEAFLDQYCKKYQKHPKKLHPTTREMLLSYHWPGNIRELRHSAERAVIMSDKDILSPGDFFFASGTDSSEQIENLTLDQLEKKRILQVLKKHNRNISKAARELGLSRSALYRRMDKYQIEE